MGFTLALTAALIYQKVNELFAENFAHQDCDRSILLVFMRWKDIILHADACRFVFGNLSASFFQLFDRVQ
jgi:hypothetical protein